MAINLEEDIRDLDVFEYVVSLVNGEVTATVNSAQVNSNLLKLLLSVTRKNSRARLCLNVKTDNFAFSGVNVSNKSLLGTLTVHNDIVF